MITTVTQYSAVIQRTSLYDSGGGYFTQQDKIERQVCFSARCDSTALAAVCMMVRNYPEEEVTIVTLMHIQSDKMVVDKMNSLTCKELIFLLNNLQPF